MKRNYWGVKLRLRVNGKGAERNIQGCRVEGNSDIRVQGEGLVLPYGPVQHSVCACVRACVGIPLLLGCIPAQCWNT